MQTQCSQSQRQCYVSTLLSSLCSWTHCWTTFPESLADRFGPRSQRDASASLVSQPPVVSSALFSSSVAGCRAQPLMSRSMTEEHWFPATVGQASAAYSHPSHDVSSQCLLGQAPLYTSPIPILALIHPRLDTPAEAEDALCSELMPGVTWGLHTRACRTRHGRRWSPRRVMAMVIFFFYGRGDLRRGSRVAARQGGNRGGKRGTWACQLPQSGRQCHPSGEQVSGLVVEYAGRSAVELSRSGRKSHRLPAAPSSLTGHLLLPAGRWPPRARPAYAPRSWAAPPAAQVPKGTRVEHQPSMGIRLHPLPISPICRLGAELSKGLHP